MYSFLFNSIFKIAILASTIVTFSPVFLFFHRNNNLNNLQDTTCSISNLCCIATHIKDPLTSSPYHSQCTMCLLSSLDNFHLTSNMHREQFY